MENKEEKNKKMDYKEMDKVFGGVKNTVSNDGDGRRWFHYNHSIIRNYFHVVYRYDSIKYDKFSDEVSKNRDYSIKDVKDISFNKYGVDIYGIE